MKENISEKMLIYRYEVGQKYDTARCETCICSLQGIPECRKKKCKPCEKVIIN